MCWFFFMEKLEWKPVFYNGLKTNIETSICGKVRRVKVNWLIHKTMKFTEKELEGTIKKSGNHLYKIVYVQIESSKPKTLYIHQLVAATFLGYKFQGHKLVVDHFDGNTLNNKLSNLRVVSNRENSSKEKTIKSGLPVGVYFNKKAKKYISRILIGKKRIYLGTFENPEDASKAYNNKLITI